MVTKPATVVFCGHCGDAFSSRQAAYNHMIEVHPPTCPGCGLDLEAWQTVYPGGVEHQCRLLAEDARQQQSHEVGAAMEEITEVQP